MMIRGVILELHGVVLDSLEFIWQAMLIALESVGVPEFRLPDFKTFLETFTVSSEKFYQSYGFKIPQRLFDELLCDVINHYFEDGILLYPGVDCLLKALRARGFLVVGINLTGADGAERLLRRFRVREYFDEVCSGPDLTSVLEDFHQRRGTDSFASCSLLSSYASVVRQACSIHGLLPIGFCADYSFMRPVLTEAGAQKCIDEPRELLGLIN